MAQEEALSIQPSEEALSSQHSAISQSKFTAEDAKDAEAI